MTKSMKSLMMGAALAGLMAGNTAMAQSPSSSSKSVSSNPNLGHQVSYVDKDKHACKGQNSCKGKGGCKAGDNGCKGKNSCKGKGGCATDGSKPPPRSSGHSRLIARAGNQPARAISFRGLFSEVVSICQQIALTVLRNTASESACAFRTTTTSSSRSRSATGLKSSRKISWSMADARCTCSIRFSSSTAWCSTASRCTSARWSR